MSGIDWAVMITTMVLVVGYGIWKTKGSTTIQSYLLGGNEAKWWVVGLSVMATQASAITFLSTPGQAYYDGMEFIQFYFTLPIALIIICITFIPMYYKLKVYTAYQFLENRFDYKTRAITSILFLVQRGLAAGITIYAPAIILSSIMAWNLNLTTIFIGVIAIMYTVIGGTKAVHVTHSLQMTIILIGLCIICFLLLQFLNEKMDTDSIMQLAGAGDKLQFIDTEFDWKDRYNIWACLLAAPFLFLSYFGTDQSQVQRYISGKSVKASQTGLIMNAFLKLPLQFFILFIGVLVFVFYQTHDAPIFFNENVISEVQNSQYQEEANTILLNFENNQEQKKLLLSNLKNDQFPKAQWQKNLDEEIILRDQFKELLGKTNPSIETNDKDYVFISFILNYLPKGLVGLLLAMIFFAAMSSTASELNALGSTSTVDIYQRSIKKDGSELHYVYAGKFFTLLWGIVAILFASIGTLFENLIQFVNIVGSIFYGTILGIFLIAFYFKRINANAVFYAAVITQIGVVIIFYYDFFGYLWLNLIGAMGVIILSHLLQFFIKNSQKELAK